MILRMMFLFLGIAIALISANAKTIRFDQVDDATLINTHMYVYMKKEREKERSVQATCKSR